MSGAIEWTPDGKCAVIDVDLKPGTSIDLSKCYKGLGVGKCWIQVGGVYYQYRVMFNCYASSVSYVRFTDGQPDTYSCGVVLTGNHYIDYNSQSPSINKITIEFKNDIKDAVEMACKVGQLAVKIAAMAL